MNKTDFDALLRTAGKEPFTVLTRESLDLVAEDSEAGALLAEQGFAPDDGTAYMHYHVCKSLPNFAGPALEGGILGVHPNVLWKCHKRLVHKHLNDEHRMHAYDPVGTPYDRIIGCILTADFPPPPNTARFGQASGAAKWEIPEFPDDAPCINGVAALFKRAKNVGRFLGEHLTGAKKRQVSIEMHSTLEDMGIWRASTRELFPLREAPDAFLAALSRDADGGLVLGKLRNGEQLVWALAGADGDLRFKGMAVTTHPADRTAGIGQVLAAAARAANDAEAAEEEGRGNEEGVGVGEEPWKPGDKALLDGIAPVTIECVATSGLLGVPGVFVYRASTEEDPSVRVIIASSGTRIVCGTGRLTRA